MIKMSLNVSAPHLANLLEFASALNMDVGRLKRDFLVNPDLDLWQPENIITTSEFDSVVLELLRRTGDDLFGLHYGCFLNVRAMGLVFNISRSAANVEQVLYILIEFLRHTFPLFEVSVRKEKKLLSVTMKCVQGDPTLNRHLLDAALCVMYREMKLITDSSSRIQIRFPCKNVTAYRRLLGKEAGKGNSHQLVLETEAVNKLLNGGNLATVGELLPAFLKLLESPGKTKSFSGQVRRMILSMSSPDLPSLKQVASQFSMSQRTFQRKLSAEKESFRVILNEVKRDLARYFRKGKNLRTIEIAGLLGYSTSSAYLHALKKW